MLRWLWKMQSDRGGQHAEAGVLMATLMLLGTAVTVGSVPQLSTAVADQWICHISDRGSDRCGGEAPEGNSPAAPGRSLLASGPEAGSGAGADSAASHFPRTTTHNGGGGEWWVPGLGTVTMESCTASLANCTGGRGRLYECATTTTPGPQGLPVTLRTCSREITAATPLTCTDEGNSPGIDICFGPDGQILHCTNADAAGNRHCTDTNHDADAQMPGVAPVSCGPESGTWATCMGSNGTLYQCPNVATSGACPEGGRNINPGNPSLTDCNVVLNNPDGTGAAVRCTYTPASCNPPPADGSSCASQAVSVRCLLDGSDSPNGAEYQHCQSLGEVVPAGTSLQSVCVEEHRGLCDEAVTTRLSAPPDDLLTAPVGDGTVGVKPDSVVEVGGKRYDQKQLTALCESDPARCDSVLASTLDRTEEGIASYFQEIGVCGPADCDAFLDQLAAAGNPAAQSPAGRTLQDDRTQNALNLGTAVFFGANAVNTAVESFVVDTPYGYRNAALGLVAATLFMTQAVRGDLRAGEGRSALRPVGAATKAVLIAAAAHLRSGATSFAARARSAGTTAAEWAGEAVDGARTGAAAVGPAASRAWRAIVDRAVRIREAVTTGPAGPAGDDLV